MSSKHDALAGQWLHSYEEDTPTDSIYRPASMDLPPSRGRTGFELKSDGTAIELGIGPNDATTEMVGSWHLENGDTLLIELPGARHPLRMVIDHVEPDRLAIKR